MPQSRHRLKNDLECVEWEVKPYYTHTLCVFNMLTLLFIYSIEILCTYDVTCTFCSYEYMKRDPTFSVAVDEIISKFAII